jgi:hypothetical protein
MTSRVAIPLDGSTRLFTVPFPYISRTHVFFSVNNTLQLNPLNYTWVNDTQIEFNEAPSGTLEIFRRTPVDEPLVRFNNGSRLTEDELNLAVLQNLYISQEMRDYYEALVDGSLDRLWSGGGDSAGSVLDKVTQEILSSELLAILQQRITDIDLNAATVNAQRIRLDTVEEIIDALASVDGESITTFLQNEQAARIEGDNALASSINLIGAKSGDALSFIIDLAKVKVSPTESLGSRLAAISTSLGNNAAAIANEQTARTTAISAVATNLSNVTARVGTAEGLITSEQTARATADTALGTRIDGLLAQVNEARALILTEQTVRAAADSAEATARTTLQTQVNNNQASLSTVGSVVDGLKASYVVKTDVNGYVSGYGLYNSGGSSEFIILANKFALVTPGQAPTVPFAADAGGVYMNTAYIRNLVVDKITGGAIQSQWNINDTNGRIVLDTGTHMKVLGVGFGANSDLIEWFGLKMPISSCTKANAITYVGTNGSAYFGGSLRAGTLYNAARTTTSTVPTSAVIGPFATNGNTKVIVVSYVYRHARPNNPTSIGNGTGGTATVKLYRTYNGTETLLATYTATAVKESSFEGGAWAVNEIATGSWTYTDTLAGTNEFTYRVEVSSRTGMSTITGTPNQEAGAVITEE